MKMKYNIARVVNKLGKTAFFPKTLKGRKFKIPIHKKLGVNLLLDSEPWMDEVLEILGNESQNFLDVGVNIGQTLLKWKSLFPDKNYEGIEPNRNCLEYVRLIIDKNNLNCVKLHPFALSTNADKGNLFLLENDPGDSSATTIGNFRQNENRVEMPIEFAPLSHLTNTKFDLVKIDVEGGELSVLQALFDYKIDCPIICEILPVYNKDNSDRLKRQEEIQALLQSYNYTIYRIIKSPSVRFQKLDGFDIHGNLDWCDYVFLPANRTATILNFVDT